jgi:membrane protease YdiL (CAAX protease family)
MSLFDDNPQNPLEENEHARLSSDQQAETASEELFAPQLGGDPLSAVAMGPGSSIQTANLPEDLRISWSWPHLLVFVFFGLASQLVLGVAVFAYLSTDRHLSKRQLQHLLESDPKIIIGTNVLWFALIFLFLYVTLAVLRDSPFWRSLGWKKLNSDPLESKGRPWMYFLCGCGLSIFVVLAGSQVKDAEHAPIQELFKNRTGALGLMAMAVLVAPLVEETVFRGYLYPVFVRILSAIARFLGMEYSVALRASVVTSILMTGTLFGLMHGYQLGWTWGLVSLLILVGIIFTFARAWTGTVLASFLLHLGYNFMIAVTSIIATKGFTHMPTGH